jgi:serine/threonine-protein kinase
MGIVVAARHTQLEQRVALKFLLPAACEAPGAIARFLREGKAAARITSEHVARVVDTGVLDNGAPYLVMEYLEGADLGAITVQRGPLHFAEAVEYVLQACEAIVEAHQLGIVHRDLKPANLFLSRRKDGSPLVKVLDFGISKAEGGSQTQLTSTSMLMGSPRYMSPEQMVSAKDVDARTDVWALGVILYELVTGRPVWQADTVQGLCALIATAPAPPLRQHAPLAPALLEEAVFRCLAKSPEQRLKSVADLALALEPIAPASARTSIDRILRVAGRTRSVLPARPAPPLGAVPPMAMAARPTAVQAPSGGRFVLLLAAGIGVLVVAGIALNAVVAHRPHTDASAIGTEPSPTPAPPPPTAATPTAPVESAAPPASVAAETAAPASASNVVVVSPAAKSAPRSRPAAPFPSPPAEPKTAARASEPAPTPVPRAPSTEAPNRALTDRK